MANVLGATQPPTMGLDERLHHLFARFPEVKVHLYGKAARPGRKIGHVTVAGRPTWPGPARPRALAAHWLAAGQWADGYDIHEGDRR